MCPKPKLCHFPGERRSQAILLCGCSRRLNVSQCLWTTYDKSCPSLDGRPSNYTRVPFPCQKSHSGACLTKTKLRKPITPRIQQCSVFSRWFLKLETCRHADRWWQSPTRKKADPKQKPLLSIRNQSCILLLEKTRLDCRYQQPKPQGIDSWYHHLCNSPWKFFHSNTGRNFSIDLPLLLMLFCIWGENHWRQIRLVLSPGAILVRRWPMSCQWWTASGWWSRF